MSIYSNVAEQDLINLRKLAEQQKNQRAEKLKNRILKQTHDAKLANPYHLSLKNYMNLLEKSAKTLKIQILKMKINKS